jgi:hypothetical protein
MPPIRALLLPILVLASGSASQAYAQYCANCGSVSRTDALGVSFIGQTSVPNLASVTQGAAGDTSSVVQGGASNFASVNQGGFQMVALPYTAAVSTSLPSAFTPSLNLPVDVADRRLVEVVLDSSPAAVSSLAPPRCLAVQGVPQAGGNAQLHACDDETAGRRAAAEQVAERAPRSVSMAEVAEDPAMGQRVRP